MKKTLPRPPFAALHLIVRLDRRLGQRSQESLERLFFGALPEATKVDDLGALPQATKVDDFGALPEATKVDYARLPLPREGSNYLLRGMGVKIIIEERIPPSFF